MYWLLWKDIKKCKRSKDVESMDIHLFKTPLASFKFQIQVENVSYNMCLNYLNIFFKHIL